MISSVNNTPLLWSHIEREECNKPKLSVALLMAIEAYKETMLEGLHNKICEDEIRERVAEFIDKFKPVDATEEELANFKELVANLERSLHDSVQLQRVEKSLVVSGSEAQEESREDSNSDTASVKNMPQHEFARLAQQSYRAKVV